MAIDRKLSPLVSTPRRLLLGAALGTVGAGLWPRKAAAEAGPFSLRYRLLHSFGDPAAADGQDPRAEVIPASDGFLYGTTLGGGRHGNGTVFRAEQRPAGPMRVRVLHHFVEGESGQPWAPLMQASDGLLYGTAFGSDRQGTRGSLFRLGPESGFEVLTTFGGTRGSAPRAGLVQAADGHLYGTTSNGGAFGTWGVAYRWTLDGQYTVLHDFDGAQTGGTPVAELLAASDGLLYGTTAFGGQPDLRGVVFSLSPQGEYIVVHPLVFAEGEAPSALVETADGSKLGIANNGGLGFLSSGTAYRIGSDAAFQRLYRFLPTSPVGQNPGGGSLLLPAEGGLVGTTQSGGLFGGGSVYRLIGRKAELLHAFDAAQSGLKSGLTLASDGRWYGTTASGGAFGHGTIYSLEPRAAG